MEELVYQGAEVKALGNGRVGGFLVLFSAAKDPDLARDYFTRETDFGGASKSAVLYNHGLDPTLGKRTLGDGVLETKDAGVWIEAQLNLRDEYEQKVYELAQRGKLGWSSGTASHLVERERDGGSAFVKKWPLGLDASLTPTPCEPRTCAMPLKSVDAPAFDELTKDLPARPAHGLTLAEHSEQALGSVREFTERMEAYQATKSADARPLSAQARESIEALVERLNAVLDYRSPQEIKASLLIEQLRLEAETTQALYGTPK